MLSLEYDIEEQDLVITNGGLTLTDNPSVQNGGIVLLFRSFNVDNLILGIGINQIRGGSVLQANYEMNRWRAQVVKDGGRASVTTRMDGGNTFFNWGVNYE